MTIDSELFMQTHVSVDCVIFGFDKNQLSVLVQRNTGVSNDKETKLPGSLIYQKENADEVAYRVLYEQAGIDDMKLKQFKCFISLQRTANPDDADRLEDTCGNKENRLITIAYLSICKIDRELNIFPKHKTVAWCPFDKLPQLPFDQNQIVEEALNEIRTWVEYEPSIIFELLPNKFTASEFRRLCEAIYRKKYDARNFHKKMSRMRYLIQLEEKQKKVPHRAGHYYRFNKVSYRKHSRILIC